MKSGTTSPKANATNWYLRISLLLVAVLSSFWVFAPEISRNSRLVNVFAITFAVQMLLTALESPIALGEKLILLLLPLGLMAAVLHCSTFGLEPAGALTVPVAWAGSLFFWGESRFRNLNEQHLA